MPWVVGSINVLADQPLSLSRTTFRELPLGRPVRRKQSCKHSCPCASARGRIPQVLQRKMFARDAWMCFRLRENLSQTEGLQSWINFICMIVKCCLTNCVVLDVQRWSLHQIHFRQGGKDCLPWDLGSQAPKPFHGFVDQKKWPTRGIVEVSAMLAAHLLCPAVFLKKIFPHVFHWLQAEVITLRALVTRFMPHGAQLL